METFTLNNMSSGITLDLEVMTIGDDPEMPEVQTYGNEVVINSDGEVNFEEHFAEGDIVIASYSDCYDEGVVKGIVVRVISPSQMVLMEI